VTFAQTNVMPPEQARLRLYEAIGAFFAAIARAQPPLLHIDDLHWADPATLDLLCYIIYTATLRPITVPADEIERLLYIASVFFCLPSGMAEPPSAGTGTAMRPDTLRRYASEADFCEVENLPIEHPFFHFYRLCA
jgi:hypothetical protein